MPAEIENKAELIEIVIAGISEGVTLRQLCRTHGFGKSTWYRWMDEDAELLGRFGRARDIGFDELAEEAIDIADDGSNDWMERHDAEGGNIGWRENGEAIGRSRLRVDTRLKLLAKWDPRRYGDKTLIGSDPDNPLPASFQVNLVKANETDAG